MKAKVIITEGEGKQELELPYDQALKYAKAWVRTMRRAGATVRTKDCGHRAHARRMEHVNQFEVMTVWSARLEVILPNQEEWSQPRS